jgi:hypothetical protein
LLKDAHYKRNAYNRNVSFEIADDTWDDSVSAFYHQQGCGSKGNVKYVSPDGHSEAIFNDKLPVIDPLNGPTYNFADPRSDWFGHFVYDMLPYWIWGNSPADPSNWYERPFGAH